VKRPFLMAIASYVLAVMPGLVALGAGVNGPHPAIVRIMALESDGASFGSGSLVAVNDSHGLVVTNWHVVRDATGPITVFFPDGFHSGATVLRTDRDWDLAALAIWRPKASPIPMSTEAPRPGEVLTIAGYGSGEFRAVAGRCTQYVSPGGNHPYEMVELDAPARNGDSGGPILNSRGELAGVLFGSAFGRTTGSYSGRLRWFLNSVISDFQQMPSPAMLAQQQQSQATGQASSQPTGQTASSAAPQFTLQTVSTSSAPPASSATSPVASIPGSPASNATASNATASNAAPSTAATSAAASSSTLPSSGGASNTAPTSLASNAGGHASSDAARKSPSTSSAQPNASSTGDTAAKTVVAVPSPPTSPLPNADQLKTIFAAIGILAVLYVALRMLGSAVG
jgi:hypothetical protein